MVIHPVPRRAAAVRGALPVGLPPVLTGWATGRAGKGSSAAAPHSTAAGGPVPYPRAFPGTFEAVLR
ncbi:hypothetical protein [Streptomyces sp. N2A]|uniref:hypothetical protein n=1 Tax=Streptomyces sp. N2A TaxID=3073936 RepID=UPI00286FB759|nr:hypothetical protein [Streptomyces sp. N2A]